MQNRRKPLRTPFNRPRMLYLQCIPDHSDTQVIHHLNSLSNDINSSDSPHPEGWDIFGWVKSMIGQKASSTLQTVMGGSHSHYFPAAKTNAPILSTGKSGQSG